MIGGCRGATLGFAEARQGLRVRDLVVEPERYRDRRGRAIDQKLQPPWLRGVEARVGGQGEHPGVLHPSHALGGEAGPSIVVLNETEGVPVLDHAQAVEAPAFGLEKEFLA